MCKLDTIALVKNYSSNEWMITCIILTLIFLVYKPMCSLKSFLLLLLFYSFWFSGFETLSSLIGSPLNLKKPLSKEHWADTICRKTKTPLLMISLIKITEEGTEANKERRKKEKQLTNESTSVLSTDAKI